MKSVARIWLSTLVAGCALLAVAAMSGCRSADRTTTAGTTTPTTMQSRAEDTLAGSDAQRAKAALKKQRADEGAQRPAAPGGRASTGVVDQPRVGGTRR
jgi:hypothetical protein